MKAGGLWLSSFACLPLAAWPLLSHASHGGLSLPARIGLAFVAGAVLISGWMTALALIGLPWQPAVLVAFAGATAFLLRLCLSSERATVQTPSDETPARLLDHQDRLPLVLSGIGHALWSAGWALPYLLPLAALIAAPQKSRLVLLPLGTSAVLAAFLVFTYLHGETNPKEWIGWSAGRIFSPIVPLLAIAGVCRRRQTIP